MDTTMGIWTEEARKTMEARGMKTELKPVPGIPDKLKEALGGLIALSKEANAAIECLKMIRRRSDCVRNSLSESVVRTLAEDEIGRLIQVLDEHGAKMPAIGLLRAAEAGPQFEFGMHSDNDDAYFNYNGPVTGRTGNIIEKLREEAEKTAKQANDCEGREDCTYMAWEVSDEPEFYNGDGEVLESVGDGQPWSAVATVQFRITRY